MLTFVPCYSSFHLKCNYAADAIFPPIMYEMNLMLVIM